MICREDGILLFYEVAISYVYDVICMKMCNSKWRIWTCCEICENGIFSLLYKIPDHIDSYWNDWISKLMSWGRVTILWGCDFVWICIMWICMEMCNYKKLKKNGKFESVAKSAKMEIFRPYRKILITLIPIDWISDMISRGKVIIWQGGNFVWMRKMWICMKMWD